MAPALEDEIVALRKWLTEGSLDAGADPTAAARDAALSMTVDATLPLEQTAQAHDRVDANSRGPVLIEIPD